LIGGGIGWVTDIDRFEPGKHAVLFFDELD
jgi:hypothetical protein